ncbi:MAG TPA: serine hydrolase domain-containing protein, partial [Acidimicrobiales bacterium]|nr:serine hydrolase domain-containing protein [Acidimicrobiales bacterium]
SLTDTATELALRALAHPPMSAETSWTEAWRRAEIPAANGHGNARSVAQVQSVLAAGGGPGSRGLISAAGAAKVFEQQSYNVDLILGVKIRHGIGYGLMCPETPLSPSERACFWGGWGGSIVVVDIDKNLVIAYMMNKMGEGTMGDLRGVSVVFAAYQSLVA